MWVDRVLRDVLGMVAIVGTPASGAAYTHSTGAISTATGVGLIWRYIRESSGNATGFVTDIKYMQGSGGTAYLERSTTWDTTTAIEEIGSSTGIYVRRPLLTSERVYSEAITSGTTGSYLTSYSYTTYSGSSQPLALAEVNRTSPTVSSGNNGPGTAHPFKTHLGLDGREDFSGTTDGTNRVIEYTEHTKGLVTKKIRDANTTSLSPPSGFTSIGSAFIHDETSYAFDEQGRRRPRPPPRAGSAWSTHTVLKDRRLVTLELPQVRLGLGHLLRPGRLHRPQPRRQGRGPGRDRLHGRQHDHGPDLAHRRDRRRPDHGGGHGLGGADADLPLRRGRARCWRRSGPTSRSPPQNLGPTARTTTRRPTATTTWVGAGGSRRRTGRSRVIVYDALGRQTSRWIGTCDSTFSGGEAGTDNMVATEATVYDGGSAGGNSLVTTRTLFVEDTTTGQRQTTYDHDLRGNVVLATNPQAPHLFYKLDNMDRVIAVGGFSSTASITVASDDPTTETTNRVSLSQTFYDEQGRAWKDAAPQDRRQRRQRRRQPADALVV